MTEARIVLSQPTDEAEAGCREPFIDAALYDYDYRHRRADINFYRQLARDRMSFAKGPILDLACGTGRLLVPLLRDGHQVIGLDRSEFMLANAARRISRLPKTHERRSVLVRADLRSFAFHVPATLGVAAFHSIQHLLKDEDFVGFLTSARASLRKGGWLAFDVLPPDPAWLGRDPNRRWGRTTFRHPTTGQKYVYTTNHRYDPGTRLLLMRLYYQPVDGNGRRCGREHTVRLCHRQYWPDEVTAMLKRAGFRLIGLFAGFDGRLLAEVPDGADEHVYVSVAV